ncbi:MAG: hypothetical protein V2A73_12700, partial [Pseudomonadota bacterium]
MRRGSLVADSARPDGGNDAPITDAPVSDAPITDAPVTDSRQTDSAGDSSARTDAPWQLDARSDAGLPWDSSQDGTPVLPDALQCKPDELLYCDDDNAVFCDSTGRQTTTVECPYGCNATQRRCNDCVPDTAKCDGNSVTACDPDGFLSPVIPCPLGCESTSESARCTVLKPSNLLPTLCEEPASTECNIPEGSTVDLNTSDDRQCQLLQAQGAGLPMICVMQCSNVQIDGVLNVTGSRALAIVASGKLVINGTVFVAARGSKSGPGAPWPIGSGGYGTGIAQSGGGGAGHQTTGASGGAPPSGSPGTGGKTYGATSLVPLLPGANGGNSGGADVS